MRRELQIMDRSTAAAWGLSKYYTGKPCKQGHNAQRYTVTANCITCSRLSRKSRKLVCVDDKLLIQSITEFLNRCRSDGELTGMIHILKEYFDALNIATLL